MRGRPTILTVRFGDFPGTGRAVHKRYGVTRIFRNNFRWGNYLGAGCTADGDLGRFHVLRPDTDTEEARAHSAQDCRTFEQPHDPREASRSGGVKTSADLLPDQCLHALREPGRELAAALYLCEIGSADRAF